MNSKRKYLLFTLGIIGTILIIFNSVEMWYWYDFKLELDISQILFIIGIISLGLYFISPKYQKFLTKVIIGTLGVSLILNIHLSTENFKSILRQNRLSEYFKLETCEKMNIRFETDLKKEEIKYFQFGIATDMELKQTLKDKYGIESFGMGCLVQSEFECYNKLVYNFLKEKYNKSMNEIYKEIHTQ